MNHDDDDDEKPKIPPTGLYDVGYGKPPVEHQFKPGESGNVDGRPKGSRNRKRPSALDKRWKAIFFKESNRKITISDAKGSVTLSTAQAVFRSIHLNALKGRVGSQRLFADLYRAAHNEDSREREAFVVATVEYKLKMEKELARRRKLRITGPAIILHPDNIVLDAETGDITFREPLTAKEKAALAPWRKRRDRFEEELNELKAERNDRNCPNRNEVSKQIRETQQVLTIIQDAFDGSRQAFEILKAAKIPDEEDS